MKHSMFKRLVCLILVFAMTLSCGITGIRASAAEEITTTIPHTKTEGESNS